MKGLSPSKLVSTSRGGEWFRLARTDDGILCLESISDTTLQLGPAASAPWAFGAEVPPHIARQLSEQLGDDDDPDQVVKILARAIHVLVPGAP
jgi:hypothetical protein